MSQPVTLAQQLEGVKSSFRGNTGGGSLLGRLLRSAATIDGYIRRGVVKHATPGFYGYVVELDDGTSCSCVPFDSAAGVVHGLGASSCSVLVPGMEVAVLQNGYGGQTGCIVCAFTPQTDAKTEKAKDFRIAKTDEGISATANTDSAYSGDMAKSLVTPSVGMYKTDDTFSGDWAVFNEFGAGYFLGRTRLTARASNLARFDLFAANDVFRVAAGYFQMFTHGGRTLVFADNGGYVSKEELFSPYVWETGGCDDKKKFEAKLEIPAEKNKGGKKMENPDLARYREYTGSIAGGKQIWTSCPDKSGEKNVGLSHVAFSDSGALVFRSVSDIIFTQTSKIDVPVRVKEPEKHKSSDRPKISGKDETPEDAEWWDRDIGRRTVSNTIRQLYKRFEDNGGDWRLDSIAANEDVGSAYDKNSGSKSDIHKRSSQLVLGKDGSIVLSTAKGAEIRLQGENITISCPGKIRFQAGREIASISHGDIFSKAWRDTEISSKHGVSVSSQNRVAVYGRNSFHCNVGFLEDTKDEPGKFAADTGNNRKNWGIYFRSPDQDKPVRIESQYIDLRPKMVASVIGDDGEGNIPETSVFSVKTNKIVEAAETCSYSSVDGSGTVANSGVLLLESGGYLFGESVGVFGNSGAMLASSSSMAMMMEGGGGDFSGLADNASAMVKMVDEFMKFLADLKDVSYFSYKKKYTDLLGKQDLVVESPWVNVSDMAFEWGEEKEANKTLPWPGKGEFVSTCRQDHSKMVDEDTGFGDKEEQMENKPEIKNFKFEKFKG